MLYHEAHCWLGWPQRKLAFAPEGAGAGVTAEFARKKIGGALALAHPGLQVEVGIIAPDASSDDTEAPLALVCEFARPATQDQLDLAHRLAWNFSRTALLVTFEPHQLIAWSCYQDPTQPEDSRRVCTLPTPDGFTVTGSPLQRQVRDLLHWVNLITGRAQRDHPKKFPADGRADALLLKNLRVVRKDLLDSGLAQKENGKEFCHDLLARVIFTQFLFHRKDRDGNSFFSNRVMKRLHEDGTLAQPHDDLASVLSSKRDTYSLFRWMDARFNGDLFPGKEGQSKEDCEAAWRDEFIAIESKHLVLLAKLISGNYDVGDRQMMLWPQYSFDTIPLEFISSVYEEFLSEEKLRDKAYYTPSHLVDYVLDAVLPWNSEQWNLRILDPCCGSGIFLVKAFQRLIHRWQLANKGRDPLVRDLRPVLAENLVGVDKNPEAVRVACFSLYLAMADAIEPKHYVTRDGVRVFPRLRGKTLIGEDFFEEQTSGFRTDEDAQRYDLVIGNAPWGDGSIRPERIPGETKAEYGKRAGANPSKAQVWAKKQKWPVANHDIGPVFLGKAARLLGDSGRVAMIETASLLYWRDGKAEKLRQQLFSEFTFDEVTNLSALRREMFAESIGPACVLVFGRSKPKAETTFHYLTPKGTRTARRVNRSGYDPQPFTIEPQDVNVMTHGDAGNNPWAWSALAVGSNRDFALIKRLSTLSTLAKLEAAREVETRKGVIVGDGKQRLPAHSDKPILAAPDFPSGVFLELDARQLPTWTNPQATSGDSVDFSAFRSPQALIKQSYVAKLGRMRAVAVTGARKGEETICREPYVTVHDLTPDVRNIRSVCFAYNSQLAVYFFALTSGSFPLYISKIAVGELLTLPLPKINPDLSAACTFAEIDSQARTAFALTKADWNLIEDFLAYTLPDLLRKTPGPGRHPTRRRDKDRGPEPEMSDYCKTLTRVVQGTFGARRSVAATIYSEPDGVRLPVRMVTLHLNSPDRIPLVIEPMEVDDLLDQLASFHLAHLKKKTRATDGGGLGFQRVAYFFHFDKHAGERVMHLTIVKPDECRYWSRSLAMRDADRLANAIVNAAGRRAGGT